MNALKAFSRSFAALAVVGVVSTSAFAQQPAPAPFEPTVGQSGKDVVWVPSPQALVDRMLDMAKVTTADFLMDLGSGDGRTVITAAKRGISALGIEYNPDMVALSKFNAEKEGVTDKAQFMKADLFETDFSKATVITMFLLPDINRRLRPKILDMKAGTRVVSNTFDMGDWQPDQTQEAGGECRSYCRALFWIVPAKVDGVWKTAQGDLKLDQKYQRFIGSLTGTGNVVAAITDGKLTGDEIAFTAGNVEYTGKVSGDTIEGTAKTASGTTPFKATRAK
ncbi:MAG: class I SAM-dependent methyltransferase [Beijerinckiaceae bacterium]|nr:class I SAM-dependent methyltransferase [Beijerinckiaceae bacterium]